MCAERKGGRNALGCVVYVVVVVEIVVICGCYVGVDCGEQLVPRVVRVVLGGEMAEWRKKEKVLFSCGACCCWCGIVVMCCYGDHEAHGEIGGCLVGLLPRAWRKAESMVVGGVVVLLSCV